MLKIHDMRQRFAAYKQYNNDYNNIEGIYEKRKVKI